MWCSTKCRWVDAASKAFASDLLYQMLALCKFWVAGWSRKYGISLHKPTVNMSTMLQLSYCLVIDTNWHTQWNAHHHHTITTWQHACTTITINLHVTQFCAITLCVCNFSLCAMLCLPWRDWPQVAIIESLYMTFCWQSLSKHSDFILQGSNGFSTARQAGLCEDAALVSR